MLLPEGSRIYVTQMLGNSITAATDVGLVRISREEAARAGIIAASQAVQESDENLTLEERVWKVLGNIYDPEIPVDIVNLGLIYGVELIPQMEGGSHVSVQMTLTAPGCGMGPHLMAEAEMGIAALVAMLRCFGVLSFRGYWQDFKYCAWEIYTTYHDLALWLLQQI